MYKGMEAGRVVALEDMPTGRGGCSCNVKVAEGTKGQASQVCMLLQAPELVVASCRRLRGTNALCSDVEGPRPEAETSRRPQPWSQTEMMRTARRASRWHRWG